jgi:hypothetical protein
MCQARGLSSVLVMDHAKPERLAFDMSSARALDTLVGGGGEISRGRGSGSVHGGLSGVGLVGCGQRTSY